MLTNCYMFTATFYTYEEFVFSEHLKISLLINWRLEIGRKPELETGCACGRITQ